VVSHYALRLGDRIAVNFITEAKVLLAEKIALDILYEDDDLVIVNKPAGMVVHPACGHASGTLLNALAGHAAGRFASLLVHRLDKDTSGVIITAKNERAKNSLVKQFQGRAVRKTYLAAVKGSVNESQGRIEAPLGRSPSDRKMMVVGPLAEKMAITEFSVVHRTPHYSLIEAHPVTGRTHQIRSHFAYIGHPVLGDAMYGGPERIDAREFHRQMLHAHHVSFTHPSTGKRVEFTAPPPEDIAALWKARRG
jgi:23S rRNA pseudouridine1911/1915/1917 synthase